MIPTLGLGGLGRSGQSAVAGGGSDWSLIANAGALNTTAQITTTGANLIVLVAAYDSNAAVSDSKSNVWTPLTAQGGVCRIWYCVNPTVGSGHTFSISISYGAIFVQAWSNSGTPYPFDVENGATSGSTTSLATGSVTPHSDDELLIAGLTLGGNSGNASIDSDFTLTNSISGVSGVSWGGAMSYLIEGALAAKNPTYSWTTANVQNARIAGFFGLNSARADEYFNARQFIFGNDNAADGSTSFADQSTANRTVTASGNIQYDTAWAATGMTSSVLFDGTNDYADIPDSASLEPLALNFCIEFVFRVPNITGNHRLVGKERTVGSGGYAPFVIDLIGDSLQLAASSTGTSWDVASGSIFGTISANTEYVVVLARTGTSIEGYLGTTRGFQITSSATLFNGDGKFRMGADSNVNGDFNGWLAPLRYTVGTNGGYTGATITPPTFPFATHG